MENEPGTSQLKILAQYHIKIQLLMKVLKIQSIDTTASLVTETFQTEEKILLKNLLKNNMTLQPVLKVGDYQTAERAFREFDD